MADIAAVLDDAARLLGLLEDWLRHTDPLVHDELALFLPPGTGPSRLRAFIDVIGETALNLSRLLPGDTP